MGKLGRGTGLPQKPLPQPWIGRLRWRQQLDRHRTIEPHLAREIDDAHATASQLVFERVAAGDSRLEVEKQPIGSLVRHRTLN